MIQKNAEDNQKIQYMPNITFDGLKDKDGKPIDPDSIKKTLLDAVDMQHIKKIHFNGGEPLLNNEHTDLLLRLEQQGVLKDVFISYNTNGTQMPNEKTIELWSKARLVKLFFSIDAIGPAFEYIRWPANWNQTSKNMLDMKQSLSSNVMFGFNSAVGSYNLFEMIDVWNWFDQNISTNREGDESDFCWQFVTNFDIKHLPLRIKIEAIDQLSKISALQGVSNYIESTLAHAEDPVWMQQLSQLDLTRNTNWKNSLYIAKYIKEIIC